MNSSEVRVKYQIISFVRLKQIQDCSVTFGFSSSIICGADRYLEVLEVHSSPPFPDFPPLQSHLGLLEEEHINQSAH